MKYLACVLCFAAVVLGAPDVVARVRDGETKLPLVGASVVSQGSDIMAVTDSSGQCLVVVAPRRSGALVASRHGYLEQTLVGAWPVKPGQDTVVIDFLLYPHRSNDGVGPVSGVDTSAAITVAAAAGGNPAASVSNRPDSESGSVGSAAAQLPVPAMQADDSFNARLTEVRRTAGVEASRSPVGTASVEGTVSDAETGLPVPAARIAVEGTELEAVSDSAGRYVIEYVSAGMHKLLVIRAGYANAYTVLRFVRDWAVTANLYLRRTEQAAPDN